MELFLFIGYCISDFIPYVIMNVLGLKLVHIIKRDAMHPVKQNCKIVILTIWHFTVEPLFYGYHIMLSFILRLSYSVIHLYARTTSRIDWMWINHTQHDFDPRKKIRRFVRIILECLRKNKYIGSDSDANIYGMCYQMVLFEPIRKMFRFNFRNNVWVIQANSAAQFVIFSVAVIT